MEQTRPCRERGHGLSSERHRTARKLRPMTRAREAPRFGARRRRGTNCRAAWRRRSGTTRGRARRKISIKLPSMGSVIAGGVGEAPSRGERILRSPSRLRRRCWPRMPPSQRVTPSRHARDYFQRLRQAPRRALWPENTCRRRLPGTPPSMATPQLKLGRRTMCVIHCFTLSQLPPRAAPISLLKFVDNTVHKR